jgi:uncharacterized protein
MRLVRIAPIARIVASLIVAPAFLLPAAAQEKTMPTITVVGEGIVTAVSDLAVIGVGVVTQAPRAADALAQNSKAMAGVVAAVKEAGIEPRDVETSRVSLRPQYAQPSPGSREAPKLAGYEASNIVSIRVRALDKLGAVLDRLVIAGANQIRSVELALAEPGPLRDKARTAAMKDAQRKAELFADAAGVRIVRLFSAVEDFSEAPRPLMRMSAEAGSRPAVPIEAGEQEIRGRVTAVFEIAPK